MTKWEKSGTLFDAREIWKDEKGRELIQRPDGEWTIRPVGFPARLGLCTISLTEAQMRSDWTSLQWEEYINAEKERI